MDASLTHTIQLILTYKYFILFPIAVIEGPAISIIAGVAVSLGYLNFVLAYLTIVAADLVGDSAYYAIGYYGHKHFINKWGRFIGLNPNRVKFIDKHFKKRAATILFLGKLTIVIGVAFLTAAGLARYPFKKFIFINLAATAIKSLFLLLVGYYFGRAFNQLSKYLDNAAIGATIAVTALIIVYLVIKKVETKIVKKNALI